MTLTKKRWLLAAVPLLLLCLVLLPQEAKAAPLNNPPIELRITGSTTATVISTMPADDVVLGSVSYAATISPNAGVTVTPPAGNGSGSYTIRGLDAATQYTFTVTATDGVDPVIRTASTTFTPGQGQFTVNLANANYLTLGSVAQLPSTQTPIQTFPTAAFYNGSISFPASVAANVFSSGLGFTITSGTATSCTYNGGVCVVSGITSNITIAPTGITVLGNNNNYWGWNGGYYGYGYSYDNTYYANPSNASYSGGETVSFTVNAPIYDLNRVGVDRMLLNSGTHYTAISVSGNKTQITFTKSFLNTLSRGQHDFYFNFLYGSATARINVFSAGSGSTNTGGTGIPSGSAQALRALTVYNKASTKGKKLGNVAKGTGMVVTGFTPSGSYATINYGNQEGYVNANYINANLSEEITGRLSSTTYLYTQKSTNAKYRFVKANKNTPVTLLAREGTYWKVNYNGDVLYILASSIKDITVG